MAAMLQEVMCSDGNRPGCHIGMALRKVQVLTGIPAVARSGPGSMKRQIPSAQGRSSPVSLKDVS